MPIPVDGWSAFFNPLKVQSEVTMPARGFAVPYHFSISITGRFAFGHSAETCSCFY